MKECCKNTNSIWRETYKVPEFQSLKEDLNCDVCIVGAGIAGITTAYLLALEGKKVIILDEGSIGRGETGNTTAHITSAIDNRFSKIEDMHGEEGLKIAAKSQRDAVEEIRKIINKENILCDYKSVDGFLFFKPEDDLYTEEYEAAMRAGMNVEKSESPVEAFKNFKTLKFPDQGQFHALKYISALAERIISLNGKIFTDTFAEGIEDKEDSVIITTKEGYKITSADAVIATNSPVSDHFAIHISQIACRTYVVAYKIKKDSIPAALYWDTEEPYHYVRIYQDKENDYLIAGGEDHKTGQEDNPEERFRKLEEWTEKLFKTSGDPEFRWSGQVMEPLDGLSFIGKDPENSEHVYIITGDSGMGITHSTFGGIIIRDLITGKSNIWSELYNPSRITLKASLKFIKEGANTVSQYLELVTPGDVKNIDEIAKGEGAIIRDGLDKIAVYKDESGAVYKFSAYCTHLKCVLQWNKTEKSWDCPCHGSRFDCKGKVINGPAISDMKKI